MSQLRYSHLRSVRRTAHADAERLARFIAFLDLARGEPDTARELEAYLREQLDAGSRAQDVEQLWRTLDGEVSTLLAGLREHHADFEALQHLEAHEGSFRDDERDELRALLGLYGSDVTTRLRGRCELEHALERQLAWRRAHEAAPRGSARDHVAARAWARLGFILDALDPPG